MIEHIRALRVNASYVCSAYENPLGKNIDCLKQEHRGYLSNVGQYVLFSEHELYGKSSHEINCTLGRLFGRAAIVPLNYDTHAQKFVAPGNNQAYGDYVFVDRSQLSVDALTLLDALIDMVKTNMEMRKSERKWMALYQEKTHRVCSECLTLGFIRRLERAAELLGGTNNNPIGMGMDALTLNKHTYNQRYILFTGCDEYTMSKYESPVMIRQLLRSVFNSDALIEAKYSVLTNNKFERPVPGEYGDYIFIDRTKLKPVEEEIVQSMFRRGKHKVNGEQQEDTKSDFSNSQSENAKLRQECDDAKNKAAQLQDKLKAIYEASKNTSAGFGSVKVNSLKAIIEQAATEHGIKQR